MSKRSTGVTVWAVLLIIGGGLALVGSVASSVVGGAMRHGVLEERFRQLEAELSRSGGPDGQALPPEQAAQLRDGLRQMREKIQAFFSSPQVQMLTGVNSVLGLAALIAGIGLLLLNGWARVLAIWQAAGSIVAGVASQLLMHVWQKEMLQSLMAGAGGSAQQEAARQAIHAAQTLGFGLGVVFLCAWNGLIIWFFSRASVKAQFQGQPTATT